MYPITKATLPFLEIANHWSREIEPRATSSELLKGLEGAWWLGEIRGNSALSRLEQLRCMFRSMHDQNGLGIIFVVGKEVYEPPVTDLPDGGVEVTLRHPVPVPSRDMDDWDEDSCQDAFHALAETSSSETYPVMTPGLAFIELTYEEFTRWLIKRGYPKPDFWKPAGLNKPQRGRPPEYDWPGVKSRIAAYVLENGPMQELNELLQKCGDFAHDLHPEGSTPDDRTIRDAIKTHALDVEARLVRGK